MKNSFPAWLLVFGVIADLSACRTARRSTDVDDDVTEVTVSLANGILDKDQNQIAYVYELMGCTQGTVAGTLKDAQTAVFKTKPIKANMPTCECRISNMSLVNNSAFTWVDSGQRGLLYRASGFAFSPDINGKLSAKPLFDRRYQDAIAATNFTATLAVTFPKAIDVNATVTGQVACTPDLNSIGIYQATDATHGTLSFVESIDKGKELNFKCSQLSVWVNSTTPFSASLPGGMVTAKAGARVAISAQPVTLVAPPEQITVVTSVDNNNTCDGDKGKVRDIATGQCIDKPGATPTPAPTAPIPTPTP